MSHNRLFAALSVLVLILSVLACGLPAGGPAPAPQAGQPASSSGGSSPSGAAGACANPLYPVAVGVSWTYSLTGKLPATFTRSITAVSPDGFVDQDVFTSGITRTGDWNCNGGALIALDPNGGNTASVQAENINSNFHTTAMDGVTLPATVNAGDSWTQNFTIEGTESINGQDVASKNVTAYSCVGGASESVTVAAGTFNAIHIDCQTNITITVTMNGLDIPTNVTTTSTMWYAPGVGLVKSNNLINGADANTLELTTYSIP